MYSFINFKIAFDWRFFVLVMTEFQMNVKGSLILWVAFASFKATSVCSNCLKGSLCATLQVAVHFFFEN